MTSGNERDDNDSELLATKGTMMGDFWQLTVST